MKRPSSFSACFLKHFAYNHSLLPLPLLTMDSTNSIEKCYMSSPESTRTESDFIISEVISLEENDGIINDELSGIDFNTTIEDEIHRPLSPATPFESFFLSPDLQTSQISANALASQIRQNSRSYYSGTSLTSVATDEFGTAAENPDDLSTCLPQSKSSLGNLFGKDIICLSREPIPEVSLEYEDASIMTSTTSSTTDKTHYDVVEHVYEGAKGVWAWGKGVAVFKPFLGLAEGVTNKVLSVAGTSLADLDGKITPKLHDFDTSVLNPAIAKIVDILMATANKGEDTFGPLVSKIVNTVSSTKIEDKKTPAPEVAPEVTTTSKPSLMDTITGSGRMSYVK